MTKTYTAIITIATGWGPERKTYTFDNYGKMMEFEKSLIARNEEMAKNGSCVKCVSVKYVYQSGKTFTKNF